MKKNLLRTAVALVGAGTAATALSTAITFNTTPQSPTSIIIANEAIISAALGTDITAPDGNLTFDTGFTVSTTSRYLRMDLSSGTWGGAQKAAGTATSVEMGSTVAGITETLVSGGTTNDSFVIYQVTATKASKPSAASDDVVFIPQGGITVKDKSAVTITYGLYETAGDAVSQSSALSTDSGTLITFADETSVTATDGATVAPKIDVTVATKTGKVFAGGVSKGLVGVVNIADSAAATELLDGTAATTNNLTSASVLTVTGDMTFLQDLDTNNLPDGTYTLSNAAVWANSTCTTTLVGSAAETITDTNMTFTTTAYNADVLYVCVEANGVTDIPVQTFTANYATTGASTSYSDESTDLTLFAHAKNGSAVTKQLVLNPTGNYKNFLRITNTSTITGDVSFSLINDSGEAVNAVTLASIEGQTSSSLAGGNSTSMIDVADLYAAAQATLSTFDVGTGKLRVTVSGNFGTMDVQNITTATDNTSFDTF